MKRNVIKRLGVTWDVMRMIIPVVILSAQQPTKTSIKKEIMS